MGFHNQPSYQADIEPVTAHFAAEDHNQHGGASYFAMTGDRVTSGFAVGGAGLPEVEHHNPNLSPEQFQANRDRVRASVKGQSPETQMQAVAGSWHRKGVKGKVDAHVMDKSEVLPTREKAVSLAKGRGEDAYYDISAGKELPTP